MLELNEGDTVFILGENGMGGIGSCTAIVRDRPQLPEPNKETGESSEGCFSSSNARSCSEKELLTRLTTAGAQVGPAWWPLVGLGLRLDFESIQPELSMKSVLEEVHTLLSNGIREHDLLLQLDERARYVILLRYLNVEDAERVGLRLASHLEGLDLAGEFSARVSLQSEIFSDRSRSAQVADKLVQFLKD